jgi:hypothetical protein
VAGAGGSTFPGPTNLRSTLGPGPRDFTLAWTPPTGAFDGYNLESKTGSGAFEKANSSLIPPTYTALQFTFTDAAPEDTTFSFRLNAAKGSQTSAASNEASVNSGLNTPGQPTGQYDWDRSGIALTWFRNSAASTGFLLERAQSDIYGYPSGSWITLTVTDPTALSFLDTTVTLGANYIYRVTNTKGPVSSRPSSSSSPIYTGLPAPSQPSATYDFSSGGMAVTWTKNTTFNDGVKIERIQTNSYGTQTGTWTELTPTDPTANTFLDTSATSNTYYAYRVSNLRNGLSSTASAPSYPAFAGLTAPSYISAYWDANKGGVYLYWYAYGTYDAFTIERATCDASGQPTGSWSTVATPSGATNEYTDFGIQELTYYLYRIAGVRGQITSLTVSAYLVGTPMAAPTNLAATTATGGAQLTWQNHSAAATQLVVRRGPGSNTYSYTEVAILSSTTTSYVDPLAHLGNYHYTVVAKAGSSEAASTPTTFTTPNPPDALTLTSSTKVLPDATDAALTPTGAWGLATTSPFGMLSNNDPWTPYFPNNSLRSAGNMVQIDALGHPHLVYLILNPQNNQEALLRHAWHDGTTWQSEDMGHTQLVYAYSSVGYEFRLDSTGVPHALLDQGPYGGYTSTMTYVHKVNGAWVQESMGDISPTLYLSAYRLRLDASDVPHVLINASTSVYECTRSAQGQWSASVLAAAANTTTGFLDGFWSDGDNAIVMYSVYGSYPSYGSDIMAVKKVAGVWQLPSLIEHSDSTSPSIQVAQSPDHARIAMVWVDAYGFKALHLDTTGWHPTLLLNPSSTYNLMYRVGFDGSNKVHILFKNIYPDVGYIDFKE